MLPVALSARLVSWGNAALGGRVSPDTAADRVSCPPYADGAGQAPGHRVAGLPGEDAPVTLPYALARLRAAGVRGLRLVLPVPGDPGGLAGPPEFNLLALEAGEAVLTVGGPPLGLLPTRRAGRVVWQVHPVAPATGAGGPSLAEAERSLTEALAEATSALVALDVAPDASQWRPGLAEALEQVRDDAELADVLAPGYPPRAAAALALARRVGAIAALAGVDDGAAAGTGSIGSRARVLRALERAGRQAQVAAYNAVLEPSAGRW